MITLSRRPPMNADRAAATSSAPRASKRSPSYSLRPRLSSQARWFKVFRDTAS